MSETYIPSPKGIIKAKDLKFKTVREDWNIYELEDGTILRAKLVATKISRGLDPETGDIYYVEGRGEPIYNIRHTVVVSAEVSTELLKKPGE